MGAMSPYVVCSKEVAGLGLPERENAAILDTSNPALAEDDQVFPGTCSPAWAQLSCADYAMMALCILVAHSDLLVGAGNSKVGRFVPWAL